MGGLLLLAGITTSAQAAPRIFLEPRVGIATNPWYTEQLLADGFLASSLILGIHASPLLAFTARASADAAFSTVGYRAWPNSSSAAIGLRICPLEGGDGGFYPFAGGSLGLVTYKHEVSNYNYPYEYVVEEERVTRLTLEAEGGIELRIARGAGVSIGASYKYTSGADPYGLYSREYVPHLISANLSLMLHSKHR
jgi:hypothetical protein